MMTAMKPERQLTHRFVEYIPDDLEEDIVYVCVPFATVVHKCASGCGREIVTPISPTDWKLIFDGQTISLHPSVGNWSLPCQSHYWIRRDRVEWAPRWSRSQIEGARARDRAEKREYFESSVGTTQDAASATGPTRQEQKGLWSKVRGWFS
jgi:hypothetical protein